MEPTVQADLKSPSKLPYLFVGLAIVAAVAFFYIGRLTTTPSPPPPTPTQTISPNLLFKSQLATFEGKITGISGKTLSVESDTGEKGEFAVSDKVVIYKYTPGKGNASASADVKTIEVGRKVLISLELINGEYQASSISYYP